MGKSSTSMARFFRVYSQYVIHVKKLITSCNEEQQLSSLVQYIDQLVHNLTVKSKQFQPSIFCFDLPIFTYFWYKQTTKLFIHHFRKKYYRLCDKQLKLILSHK